MSRTKGKNSPAKNKKDENTINPDIVGIVYVATGIIFCIAIYTSLAGILSFLAQRISHVVIGIGANALPIYLIYFGFQYIKTRGNIKLNKKFFGMTIMVIVIMLTSGVINIQSLDNQSDFLGNIKLIVNDNTKTIHGGILSYLICYPLYKIIGILGAYIVLLAFSIISIILIFDITLYDLGIKAFNKGEKIRNSRNKRAREKNEEQRARESFINIVDKDENEQNSQSEKEAFLSGVNKKNKDFRFYEGLN